MADFYRRCLFKLLLSVAKYPNEDRNLEREFDQAQA